MTVREVSGDERALWWERAVAAYPPYAEYQEKTERVDPGLRRHADARADRPDQRASAKACTMAARQGTRFGSRSSGVLPRRTTTRSRAGQMVIDWPS